MKKILFATTALVATAGVAAADVAISGYAEMGVVGGTGIESQFFQDIDVTFTLSGETDSGITFGSAIDLDEIVGGAGSGSTGNDFGVAVFISGDFGTLTMGDTDGAFDWALQEVNYNGAGSINDAETGHAGYSGNSGMDGFYDGQILSYSYSIGDFAVAFSLEMDDDINARTGTFFGTPGHTNTDGLTGDPVFGIGGRYAGEFAGGSFRVGLGYQSIMGDAYPTFAGEQNGTLIGISGAVALDMGLSAAFNYSTVDIDTGGLAPGDYSGQHMAIGVSYSMDAITLHANYGEYDWDANALVADANGYGLAANYDLGGGLVAQLGYGWSDVTAANLSGTALGNSSSWSLGLAMSF